MDLLKNHLYSSPTSGISQGSVGTRIDKFGSELVVLEAYDISLDSLYT